MSNDETKNNQEDSFLEQYPELDNNFLESPERDNSERKQKLKLFLVVLAFIFIMFIVLGIFSYKLYSSLSTKGAEDTTPKSEAFIRGDDANNSISKRIEDLKKEEEAERQRQQQIAEQERLRQQQEEAERLKLLELQNKQQIAAGGQAGNGSKKEETDPMTRKMGGKALFTTKEAGGEEMAADSLNAKLSGEKYADGSINQIINYNKKLLAGSFIPCVLVTRIVTNYPSMPICQVTQNIYSSTGQYVVIPKGSKIRGTQNQTLQQGDVKIFVSWNNIDTPQGERIRIDSLGTDQLGASGLDGNIDYRFFKRFGSAIMLSFIQDAISTASQTVANKHAQSITYESSQENVSKMAELALQNSINIPPLGYAKQGTLVNILLVRDIDFTPVLPD